MSSCPACGSPYQFGTTPEAIFWCGVRIVVHKVTRCVFSKKRPTQPPIDEDAPFLCFFHSITFDPFKDIGTERA